MVGGENPGDLLDAELGQMVEDAGVAQVDQQRRVPVAEDVDVAGVGPDEEVRKMDGTRLAEPRQGPGRAGIGEGRAAAEEKQEGQPEWSHAWDYIRETRPILPVTCPSTPPAASSPV